MYNLFFAACRQKCRDDVNGKCNGPSTLYLLRLFSNPLYTGGHCYCYMLNEPICHLKGVGSILSLLLNFNGKSCKQTQ